MAESIFKDVPLPKQFSLLFSVILFAMAFFITSFHMAPKTLQLEIQKRNAIDEESEVKTLKKVSPMLSLKQALMENGIDIENDYSTDIDPNTKLFNIDSVKLSKNIDGSIKLEGEDIYYHSGAKTVEDLIKEKNIVLLESDVVVPDPKTPLTEESNNIIIHRKRMEREEDIRSLPFAITRTTDENLPAQSTIIDMHGAEGSKKVIEDVLYYDGEVVQRTVVSENLIKEPVTQIERVSKDVAAQQESSSPQNQQNTTPTNSQTQSSGNNISQPANSTQTAQAAVQGIAKTTVKDSGVIDTTSNDSYARPVNSAHPLSVYYIPIDLVSMNYGGSRLRRDAAEAFNKMAAALKEATGQDLLPLSCYRSYFTQQALEGNIGTADAGFSEHQTGLAVDLGVEGATNIDVNDHFENTPAYAWLYEHAHEYGFCNSYPQNTNFEVGFEPWHWRFLGADLAPVVKNAQLNHTCIQYDDWVEKNLYFKP